MESPIQSELAADGTAVVTVSGEIDFANADDVARGLGRVIDEWAPASVRIDLRDATFIDSTGLGALIEGYRAASAAEAEFTVVNPSDSFRRVLNVTGLSELFGLADQADPSAESMSRTGS